MAWSATPFLNTSRQELANDQNTAGTWARIAWLSGRGVPSRRAAVELGEHGRRPSRCRVDVADAWLRHR
jgi:hypothetical protein